MNRNLVEPHRAQAQWMVNVDRQMRKLSSSTAKPGRTRTGQCVKTSIPNVLHNPLDPNDGWWVDHVMCETDVDPGKWDVTAFLQYEIFYNHAANSLGYQKFHIALFSQAPGAARVEELRLVRCPMAPGVDMGIVSAQEDCFELMMIPGWTVSSDTGLHLSLAGRFELNGRATTVNGPAIWLGPGQIKAAPL